MNKKLKMVYRNYKGEVSIRTIIPDMPDGLKWGSTDHHPVPQYLMKALDVEKNEMRMFAVKDIITFINE